MTSLLRLTSFLCVSVLLGIAFSPSLTQAQVSQKVITTNANGARSVYAADLDGDGDQDVLSASSSDGKIAWYENEGSGTFSGQKTIVTSADYPRSVYAADLDEDGDLDVLSAFDGDDGGKIVWYGNEGGGTFSTQKTITTSAVEPTSVYATDLDGDSDPDVLSASRGDSKIAWYENEDSGTFSSQQTITTSADRAKSVYAADLDGDEDRDVLSASPGDDKIAWYENQGGGTFSFQKTITTSALDATSVYAADLDGDGNRDVLSADAQGKIAWYENEGNGAFSFQKTITTSAIGAQSVYAADLDGDSDPDILSASNSNDTIAWYENQGGGTFSSQQTITTSADHAWSVYAADLDGDSDFDVLSASELDDKIAWYENTDGVLPVELTDLTGQTDGTGARLTWQTASETNNAGFEVQRQKESGWTQVGYVDSKAQGGTTTETQSYNYTAEDLPVGTHQFRLKQVDLDGSSTLIDPVSVDIQMQEALRLTAPAPNPVSTTATLLFAVKEQAETTITLYNTLGQRVATVYEGTPQAGQQQRARIDATDLPSGTYFLRLDAGQETVTERITVVK